MSPMPLGLDMAAKCFPCSAYNKRFVGISQVLKIIMIIKSLSSQYVSNYCKVLMNFNTETMRFIFHWHFDY